jgi:FkbM family methyltransferase
LCGQWREFLKISICPYHPGKWKIVRALVRWADLERFYEGKSYVVVRQKIRWKLRPECMVQRSVYLYGDWESYDSREFIRALKPDGVVLDIGAYFGYYSMLACRHAGPKASVYAFEPFPKNFEILEENKRLNGFDSLVCVNLAVADRASEWSFRVAPTTNLGSGGLTANTATNGANQVRAITVDDFVAQQGLDRVDLIKMDVEGAEVLALAGAGKTLRRFRPVMMVELDPGKLKLLGETPQHLVQRIRDLGYRMFCADRRGLQPVPNPETVSGFINLFCFPADPPA